MPQRLIDAIQLAVLIFTSGSTGLVWYYATRTNELAKQDKRKGQR